MSVNKASLAKQENQICIDYRMLKTSQQLETFKMKMVINDEIHTSETLIVNVFKYINLSLHLTT